MTIEFDYNKNFGSIVGVVTGCFIILTTFFLFLPINYSSVGVKIVIIAIFTFIIVYVIIHYLIYRVLIGGKNEDGASMYIFWIATVPILFTTLILISSQEKQKIIGIFENTIGYLYCKYRCPELNEIFELENNALPEDFKDKYQNDKSSLLTLFNFVRKFKKIYKNYIKYDDLTKKDIRGGGDGNNDDILKETYIDDNEGKENNKHTYNFYIKMKKEYDNSLNYFEDSEEEKEETEEEKKRKKEDVVSSVLGINKFMTGINGTLEYINKRLKVKTAEEKQLEFDLNNRLPTPIKKLATIVGYKNTIGICSWFFISSLFASMVSVKVLTKI